tara:strand:+ start:139 stop:549 length:411 start_codon:yes stop_codon:yes gene_type:complete
MSIVLEILEKLEGMQFVEIEVEQEGVSIKMKRQPKAVKQVSRNTSTALDEFGGFATAKEVKEPGLASHGQVKYARDLITKSFSGDENGMMDFLAHTLEIPLQEIDHPDTWDETMTREMAAIILDPLEKMNGINKRR